MTLHLSSEIRKTIVFGPGTTTELTVTGSFNSGTIPQSLGILINIDGSCYVNYSDFAYSNGSWTRTFTGLSISAGSHLLNLHVGMGDYFSDTTYLYITGFQIGPTTGVPRLMRNATEISPVAGYAPWKSRGQIAISPTNSSIVVCCAGNAGLTQTGVWLSLNGGTSWVALSGPSNTNPWTRAFISGDGNNVIYLVGLSGEIGAVYNLLLPVIQKIGNITTGNELMGLAGL